MILSVVQFQLHLLLKELVVLHQAFTCLFQLMVQQIVVFKDLVLLLVMRLVLALVLVHLQKHLICGAITNNKHSDNHTIQTTPTQSQITNNKHKENHHQTSDDSKQLSRQFRIHHTQGESKLSQIYTTSEPQHLWLKQIKPDKHQPSDSQMHTWNY